MFWFTAPDGSLRLVVEERARIRKAFPNWSAVQVETYLGRLLDYYAALQAE